MNKCTVVIRRQGMPDCEIEVFEGQSLMEAMIAGGVYVSAACGGKGL